MIFFQEPIHFLQVSATSQKKKIVNKCKDCSRKDTSQTFVFKLISNFVQHRGNYITASNRMQTADSQSFLYGSTVLFGLKPHNPCLKSRIRSKWNANNGLGVPEGISVREANSEHMFVLTVLETSIQMRQVNQACKEHKR